jgi:hypothetical protein
MKASAEEQMFFSRKGLGDITSPLSLKFFHTGFWVLFRLTYLKNLPTNLKIG